MNDEVLNKLEEKAKAATPGPWTTRNGAFVYSEEGAQISSSSIICDFEPSNCVSREQADKNASFIAAASPVTMLYLIEELRKARKARDWLAYQLEDNFDCYQPDDEFYCASHKCSGCKYMSKEVWLEAAREETNE